MAIPQAGMSSRALHSPSPPHQSKRDVRRSRMAERLAAMSANFAANTQQHYRAQLNAVQVDMNLILRADPYAGLPLDDEVRGLVEDMGGLGAGIGGDAEKDYWALAGKKYSAFARGVNDTLEERDAELTALHNSYESSIAEVERLTAQRLHQAEEEHRALANTIRQRLITTISKRRTNLLRDKEQLDIADSSALLLHPSQFSLNNPGSPGYHNGQNRKTRHLRHHRAVSPAVGNDDGPNNGKRRRKNGEEDGNESPAPNIRPPPDNLGGGRSPFKDAREKNTYIQFEAPAYSLERLFTEKELAMATDTAKLATHRYFHHPPPTQPESAQPTTLPSEVGSLAAGLDAAEDHPGTPTAAVEMERTTSSVLTRGTLRANPLAALSDLATAAAAAQGPSSRDNPFAPVIPNYHAVTRSEKTGAPPPLAINSMDAESDFEMMRRGPSDPADEFADQGSDTEMHDQPPRRPGSAAEMRRTLLLQALSSTPTAGPPLRIPNLETGPARIGKGVDRLATTGFAPLASVLEQRGRMTQIGAGLAVNGMSRLGGEGMSRTTSAQGSEMGGAANGGFGGEVRRGAFAGRR
nr:hypothetical protein B0A51_07004 [Rachicladosporium sp. CCFEE 5018]